jgi:hypothetical protein
VTEIKEKRHQQTDSETNAHPFLGLKFLPLLRSLPLMTSEAKIHLSKLPLHPTAASEKWLDVDIASPFAGEIPSNCWTSDNNFSRFGFTLTNPHNCPTTAFVLKPDCQQFAIRCDIDEGSTVERESDIWMMTNPLIPHQK